MPLSETLLVIAGLLTLAMVAAGLFRKSPIPYTVILVVLGVVLGELAHSWTALAPLAAFQLSPDVVFFLFLPALIFESGYNLDARQLVKDLAPVLILAIPALLMSTAIVGFGLWLILGLDLGIALLFGALISATDPVAVIALFKELGAPARLTVLVEGESLLNDATAIVLFTILLGIVIEGGGLSWLGVGLAMVDFLKVFLGGMVVGMLLGFLVSELLHRTRSGVSAILTMSLVLAYASFIVAEHVLHVSGVMAAGTSAVVLGVVGVTRMPQSAAQAIGEIWEVVALICNSLLFILVGLAIDPAKLASHSWAIAVAIALVVLARGVGIATLVPMATRLFSLPRVSAGERCIMWWGGLKGGLAIAIVLSIPQTMPLRDFLISLTLGVVTFTLLVNAPTIRPMMRWFGLDRLSENEQSDLAQVLNDARVAAQGSLARFENAGLIAKVTKHQVAQDVGEALAGTVGQPDSERLARQLRRVALRSEVAELANLRDGAVISQYCYLDMRNALRRKQEREDQQEDGEAGRAGSVESPFLLFEKTFLRRLREHDWAARLLAAYQNSRLANRMQTSLAFVLICDEVMAMLAKRVDANEAPSRELVASYQRRRYEHAERLRSLHGEFPDFCQRFQSRLCGQVALTSARNKAMHRYHQGGIGAKGFTNIERLIEAKLEALPPIWEAPKSLAPSTLIALVPLLEGLSESAIEKLANHASTVTVLPNDIIIGEGDKGDALYIVTQGQLCASKRQEGGEEKVLGLLAVGDFFGEMALLGDNVRTASVRAQTASSLLRLTRRDVLNAAEQDPELKRGLEQVRAAHREGQE